MGILDRIKSIEEEMARTQKNKATMSHLCRLKAQLAKLRSQLLEPDSKSGAGGGDGFEVSKTGSARVALIGFPSVGKSTLLSALTDTKSVQAAYEFTTLTCIPGNLYYKDTKIQILDLPGIIEGAAHGKGRGRQVIACAKSADLVLMVLDAAKESELQIRKQSGGHDAGGKNITTSKALLEAERIRSHREILENELEIVGMRLNRNPPNLSFVPKKTGGVKINSIGSVSFSNFGDEPEKTIRGILQEYKIHNCELLFKEDVTPDELIDVIEGNRKYVRCLYVYNKIDTITIEEVDMLARNENSIVISLNMKLNVEELVEKIWEYLGLVRIYTKPKGQPPDFTEPVVLTRGRYGCTVKSACVQIHRGLVNDFNYAFVWGSSTKHLPQCVGLSHALEDEDVIQVVKKTTQQMKKDSKGYNDRVQAHWENVKEKRRKFRVKK